LQDFQNALLLVHRQRFNHIQGLGKRCHT
jgi:hypothetical protein